jgi:hypothetical protein
VCEREREREREKEREKEREGEENNKHSKNVREYPNSFGYNWKGGSDAERPSRSLYQSGRGGRSLRIPIRKERRTSLFRGIL